MSSVDTPKDATFMFSNQKRSGKVMNSHHRHDDKFEIYYMVSGKCRYFIDDKPYEVMQGDVVLIPGGVLHRTDYDDSESTRLLVECTYEYIPKDVLKKLSAFYYVYRNPTITREIHIALSRIENEYRTCDEMTVSALKAQMQLFFYLLIRNADTVEKTDSKNVMIENAIGYIRENYQSEVTLSAVAKANFVSPEHLSRTFKKETGFGFNEYLTLVRLQQAELMLREHEPISISEIAYSCGFNDSNYFSDRFKKSYGISPLRYRKSCI